MLSKRLKNLHKLLANSEAIQRLSCRSASVWTPEKVIKSPFKDVELPNRTIFEHIWENLDRWPERTATVCGVTGRGYTYEQAFKLSYTFAANLRRKFRLRDGDVVAVMLPNLPDYPLVVLGILEAGGIPTTINPIYTPHEVQRQLIMSGAKVIVTLTTTHQTVKEALRLAKKDMPIVTVRMNNEAVPEGTVCFSELSEDVHVDKSCLKEVRVSHKDVCFLPYSSGTTGLPKGVELTSSNIIANCVQLNEPRVACGVPTTPDHQDVTIVVLPFFHIYAATVLMFHKMSNGIKLVTMPKFTPETFFNAMIKYKVNLLFAAPPIVLAMSSHPLSEKKHFQYLELIMSGASPLPSADVRKLFDKAERQFDFLQGYGLTETSPVATLMERHVNNYSSVGYALPSTQLMVVDSDLNPLGPNETGEILIRGPQVMKGYKDNPTATKDTFHGNWFRSGDLGRVDENGAVYISDRLKELIKVKGYQVPPAELEGVLREHPSVLDAAVVGAPHPRTGEVPKAFVVMEKGQAFNKDDLVKFVADRVAPYKRIEDISVLPDIPKNASGKILRRVLKEKYVSTN